MSENDESTEQDTTAEDEGGSGAPGAGAKLRGALSKDSDMAQRPGFRNPANARSKAQKKKAKKKGRR